MAIALLTPQPGVLLTTTSAAMFTSPPALKVLCKRCVLTNIATGSASATVTLTRSGGAPLTIINAQSIAANSAYTAPELSNLVLNPGDVLSASSSAAASVNLFASGFSM